MKSFIDKLCTRATAIYKTNTTTMLVTNKYKHIDIKLLNCIY